MSDISIVDILIELRKKSMVEFKKYARKKYEQCTPECLEKELLTINNELINNKENAELIAELLALREVISKIINNQ